MGLEVFGGRLDRGLIAGMTSWERSRTADNKVITDDLALLVRQQIFSKSHIFLLKF